MVGDMRELDVNKLSRSQKLVIGHLCAGNSALDLAMMLVEKLTEVEFNEILVETVKDLEYNMDAFNEVVEQGYRTVAG